MSTPIQVRAADVLRAVMGSDAAPQDVLLHDAERVIAATLQALALAALSRSVAVHLGNGHALVITVQPSRQAGGHA
ncbi:hypothetical protein HNQ51_001737 [Inhella inkyongensis]|uniref:Uncharacterized protein n=1 Tax=Inhella inkyongensis TaxID=392593 RepID=A0A840S3X6_9BURK|nr:hypothetical protein [Inhella inkyongensis]MBB5204423.1 hypothetical protein [Inhella inkyongensis]